MKERKKRGGRKEGRDEGREGVVRGREEDRCKYPKPAETTKEPM